MTDTDPYAIVGTIDPDTLTGRIDLRNAGAAGQFDVHLQALETPPKVYQFGATGAPSYNLIRLDTNRRIGALYHKLRTGKEYITGHLITPAGDKRKVSLFLDRVGRWVMKVERAAAPDTAPHVHPF